MKITELFGQPGKEYVPKISVNMDDVDSADRSEIAGMLRGLMCSIEALLNKSMATKNSQNSPIFGYF